MNKKNTILLVEDEALISMTEKLALEKHDYNVIIAETGEKAIEIVKSNNNIDLILMDINLGEGIDGTETSQIILKDNDIPIVFLSSHSEKEIVDKTEKISSYGYILKGSSITVIDASIKMAFKLFYEKQKTKTNETFIRTVLDNLPIGISVNSLDPTLKFEYTNDNFCRYLCINNKEELYSNDFWLSLSNSNNKMFFEDIKNTIIRDIKAGVTKNMVWENILLTQNNNRIKYISAQAIPIPNSTKIIFIVWDVTEKQQFEKKIKIQNENLLQSNLKLSETNEKLEASNEELEATNEELEATNEELISTNEELESVNLKLFESEKKYSEIFNSSRDGYVIVDSNGSFINANESYCKMLGWTLEELKAKKDFYEITPKKWRDWEKKYIWENRLLKNGYSGIYQKEYIRKDGVIIPVELQSYAFFNENNEPEYLWGIARDITNIKLHEKEIRNNRKKLKDILNDLPALVSEFLPDGTLTYVNKSYCDYFSLNSVELIGKSFFNLLPEDSESEIKTTLMNLSVNTPNNITIHKVLIKNKIRFHELHIRAIFDDNNRIIQFRSIGFDITDRINKGEY